MGSKKFMTNPKTSKIYLLLVVKLDILQLLPVPASFTTPKLQSTWKPLEQRVWNIRKTHWILQKGRGCLSAAVLDTPKYQWSGDIYIHGLYIHGLGLIDPGPFFMGIRSMAHCLFIQPCFNPPLCMGSNFKTHAWCHQQNNLKQHQAKARFSLCFPSFIYLYIYIYINT